jgi:hypothetical protein
VLPFFLNDLTDKLPAMIERTHDLFDRHPVLRQCEECGVDVLPPPMASILRALSDSKQPGIDPGPKGGSDLTHHSYLAFTPPPKPRDIRTTWRQRPVGYGPRPKPLSHSCISGCWGGVEESDVRGFSTLVA